MIGDALKGMAKVSLGIPVVESLYRYAERSAHRWMCSLLFSLETMAQADTDGLSLVAGNKGNIATIGPLRVQ